MLLKSSAYRESYSEYADTAVRGGSSSAAGVGDGAGETTATAANVKAASAHMPQGLSRFFDKAFSVTLRIGSGQGYYGDDVLRALPMIERRAVDVVCFEALSELTLAILRRQAQRDPARGYTRDVETIARRILARALEARVPIVTNAGGLNPRAAAQALARVAQELGLPSFAVAIVTGDDVLESLPGLCAAGELFHHLETGEQLDPQRSAVSANVYLGAQPIAGALERGADVVITGRVADPSLYLAPLARHFGWSWDDWDRLAAGTICGHLLECTAQIVGGNTLASLGTLDGADLAHLGYPIAEVEDDGSFVVTKLEGTPGIVTEQTVKEQLLYEIHDPGAYLTPDVVVDMYGARVEAIGPNRVRVSGIKGKPRPPQLKCVISYESGFARELIFRVGAPEAHRKAEQLEAMLDAAWRDVPLERTLFERLGGPDELLVRAAYAATAREPLEAASRRALALGLSGPAGMATLPALIGAPDRALLELWPALVSRDKVAEQVELIEVAGAARR